MVYSTNSNRKYIIIGYCVPDIKNGTANINVLCDGINGCHWENPKYINKNTDSQFKLFDTRKEAQKYIKNCKLDCCTTYGISI